MTSAIEALDALGLALADHGHFWTNRERQLYEAATSASRMDADWSASARYPQQKPSTGSPLASGSS